MTLLKISIQTPHSLKSLAFFFTAKESQWRDEGAALAPQPQVADPWPKTTLCEPVLTHFHLFTPAFTWQDACAEPVLSGSEADGETKCRSRLLSQA